MHIGFRTSGGRGEYEVVGTHSGYTAASLEGWSFFMLWPDGEVRNTGLWLDPGESGKPRLRSTAVKQIQIGRIVASMLLLPDPTRSFKSTPFGWPVIQAKKYTITQVGFSPESDFAGLAERVTFRPSWIEVANQGDRDAIGVAERWRRVEAVYSRQSHLPLGLSQLLGAHRDVLSSGVQIDDRLTRIVAQLSTELVSTSNAPENTGGDPLLALESLLGFQVPDGEPSLPSPDQLSEDEPEISARSAFQYRQMKVRGISGRQFSQSVRAAYGYRCAFCGLKLGRLEGVRSGIDAAHILAWSKHELDVLPNGIALCKLHHWAFDAGIMLPVKDGNKYSIQFTVLAERIDSDSLGLLGKDGAVIPEEWLPVRTEDRPSIYFLERLYADLGVTFREELI